MSKNQSTASTSTVPGFSFIKTIGDIKEFVLKENGLRVLYQQRPETGIVTTNITYLVGARDEMCRDTGLAHMLEHMLFKPTSFDVAAKKDSASMTFERDTGAILNANTWKDRTTYYFSYPKEYFERALQIEAERMVGVILTDKELAPEKMNVLSEFDMNNGDPHFALAVQMSRAAFNSHPYGHETIGFREDIEDYTATQLERFYRNYYRPDNAVMMVIGDVDEKTALTKIKAQFVNLKNPETKIPRLKIREPKQEGERRVTITRPSTQNIVSIGFKHPGFPSTGWFETALLMDVLAGSEESVLYKLLVDSGKASSVDASIEPSSDESMGTISVNMSKGSTHAEIESLILNAIASLNSKTVSGHVAKAKVKFIAGEKFTRDSSLKLAQELTEYVSSGQWEAFGKTVEILESITPKAVLARAETCFDKQRLIIGTFIGTKQ